MTTNKTFLILLLAGVSYTAYNASAVSENFEISTTIDHEIVLGSFRAASTDAGLGVDDNLEIGVITIDPTKASGGTGPEADWDGGWWGGVISVKGYKDGHFRASIPLSQAKDHITVDDVCWGDFCVGPWLDYDISEDYYYTIAAGFGYSSVPKAQDYEGEFTITYNPD
ncbi:MAG: hypothetical protein IJ689_00060 [Alphaproteobacteria bacterium]|nr:hypothetical protein [Alphaproteobacteria bacterium]